MKKFALLPLAALLMLGACSDDDPAPERIIPTDPVVSVASTADQVTLDVPEQDLNYEIVGPLYRFTYANGQKITYQMTNDFTLGYIARVKKIEGATDVIIPPTVSVIGAVSQQLVTYKVVALDLYQEGAPDVKKITMSKDVFGQIGDSNTVQQVTASWLRNQLEKLPALESFELETGYPGFCSIDGAIYTSDYKTLVGVPRGRAGMFTIAEDTENVDTRAFYYCNYVSGITFPAGVKSIGKDAVAFNERLALINMLPTVAPATNEFSFGAYGQTSVLRIPAGSKDSYFPAKPEIEEPVAPKEPDIDLGTDEEFEQYDIDYAQYLVKMAEYNKVMNAYNNPIGFRKFTKVEEVNF